MLRKTFHIQDMKKELFKMKIYFSKFKIKENIFQYRLCCLWSTIYLNYNYTGCPTGNGGGYMEFSGFLDV